MFTCFLVEGSNLCFSEREGDSGDSQPNANRVLEVWVQLLMQVIAEYSL